MSDLGLPTHVLTEIDSPIREDRLTAVDELTRLAGGADLAMAAAARRALEVLTEDDSRSVSAAAAAALARTAIRLRPDRVDFGQIAPGTPRVVADVLVDGPPLATATATVTVSGPGLRAMLAGQQLRILWQPRSEWLDGSVTVRGAAGWSEVRVTGQVPVPAAPVTRTGVEAQMRAVNGLSTYGPPRVTVLPPPPERRHRVGAAVLIAGLTALVLLGGVGVAWALVNDRPAGRQTALNEPLPTSAPAAQGALGTGQVGDAPAPAVTITREPLAHRVVSVARPTVIGTIRVGNEPEGVAVSPDSKTMYVANQNSRILSIVDAGTRKVTSVTLRNTPRFVAVSRDGRQVFVSMYEDDKKTGSGVAVLDAAARKVDHYLKTGDQPYVLSVSPDGNIWVPIHSAGRIEVYTAGEQKEINRITVPPNPHAIGYAGDLMRAFTANHESNAVAVVDMRTDKLLKAVPVSRSPHSLSVSPDGRRVLVAGYDADAADLIDTVTLRRTGPFKVGHEPQSVAFAADGEHAYVVNEGDNTISVLDGHTGKLTATVKVGGSPRTIAVSPDGRLAYVSNGADDTVSVLRVGE